MNSRGSDAAQYLSNSLKVSASANCRIRSGAVIAPPSCSGGDTHGLLHQISHLGRVHSYPDTFALKRFFLGLSRSRRAWNDWSGMPHLFPRRCSKTGDIGYNGLGHVLGDEIRSRFFFAATNLTHHHYDLSLRILLEETQHVYEIGTDNGAAADAHRR